MNIIMKLVFFIIIYKSKEILRKRIKEIRNIDSFQFPPLYKNAKSAVSDTLLSESGSGDNSLKRKNRKKIGRSQTEENLPGGKSKLDETKKSDETPKAYVKLEEKAEEGDHPKLLILPQRSSPKNNKQKDGPKKGSKTTKSLFYKEAEGSSFTPKETNQDEKLPVETFRAAVAQVQRQELTELSKQSARSKKSRVLNNSRRVNTPWNKKVDLGQRRVSPEIINDFDVNIN